ncbi:hypothetical protein D1P53_006101 [Cryptococcus gattii VGV]|nr:hypothetical protein D1P53_006101 [Cryptococcus gattii VGV]
MPNCIRLHPNPPTDAMTDHYRKWSKAFIEYSRLGPEPSMATKITYFKRSWPKTGQFSAELGDVNRIPEELRIELRGLRQRGPASDFFLRLNQLLAILDIPNDADLLVENTIHKLDNILRDEIARNQDFDPKSINELMDFIISLDNRLREREKEKREVRPSYQRSSFRTSVFQSTPTAPQGMQSPTATQHFRPGPLPHEEKERRRTNNLCMYCGNPGHTIDACPKKGKAPARRL